MLPTFSAKATTLHAERQFDIYSALGEGHDGGTPRKVFSNWRATSRKPLAIEPDEVKAHGGALKRYKDDPLVAAAWAECIRKVQDSPSLLAELF